MTIYMDLGRAFCLYVADLQKSSISSLQLFEGLPLMFYLYILGLVLRNGLVHCSNTKYMYKYNYKLLSFY